MKNGRLEMKNLDYFFLRRGFTIAVFSALGKVPVNRNGLTIA
jgi:hypothetical protein